MYTILYYMVYNILYIYIVYTIDFIDYIIKCYIYNSNIIYNICFIEFKYVL